MPEFPVKRVLLFILAAALAAPAVAARKPAPPPDWRVAFKTRDHIAYVDQAGIRRKGDEVRFSIWFHRRKPISEGGPDRLHYDVVANCATRAWRGTDTHPEVLNGERVIVTDKIETTAQPGTVYGAALDSACSFASLGDPIPDHDAHARAWFAAPPAQPSVQ